MLRQGQEGFSCTDRIVMGSVGGNKEGRQTGPMLHDLRDALKIGPVQEGDRRTGQGDERRMHGLRRVHDVPDQFLIIAQDRVQLA